MLIANYSTIYRQYLSKTMQILKTDLHYPLFMRLSVCFGANKLLIIGQISTNCPNSDRIICLVMYLCM